MAKYSVTVVGQVTKVIDVDCKDYDDARDTAEYHFAKWLQKHPDNLWKYMNVDAIDVESYDAQDGVEEAK